MKRPTLERYNQMIWAIVGTGLVAAAAAGLLAAAAYLIYIAIKDDPGAVTVDIVDRVGTAGAQPKPARYDFCQPLAVHDSPYQLIQVVSDRLVVRNVATKLAQSAARGYASEAAIYNGCALHGSADPGAIVNVLVRHADTGEMRLALKENAVVRALEYPRPEQQHPGIWQAFPPKGVVYWEIAADDSNGDGVIDDADDIGAFLSDVSASNMVRITPRPSRVLEKTYDKKRNVLLIKILPDTNGDGRLGEDDTPTLIETSVTHRKMLREVLDNQALTKVLSAAEPKRQRDKNK